MKLMYVTSGPATGTPVAYVFFRHEMLRERDAETVPRWNLSPAVSAIPHEPMFKPL